MNGWIKFVECYLYWQINRTDSMKRWFLILSNIDGVSHKGCPNPRHFCRYDTIPISPYRHRIYQSCFIWPHTPNLLKGTLPGWAWTHGMAPVISLAVGPIFQILMKWGNLFICRDDFFAEFTICTSLNQLNKTYICLKIQAYSSRFIHSYFLQINAWTLCRILYVELED